MVLGVPAGWYFGGGGEQWREGLELRAMCRGAVDTAEVKELFRTRERVRGRDMTSSKSESAHCWVYGEGDPSGFSVDIGPSGEEAAQALRRLGWYDSFTSSNLAVPTGAGWSGVLRVVAKQPVLVMVVPCGAEPLIVSLHSQSLGSPAADDPEQRARFGRIGARVAERASVEWGCGAVSGGRIERIGAEGDGARPTPGTASGTCAGVPGVVQEWPTDGKAPIEVCRAFPSDSADSWYRPLSAFYPPFGTAVRPALGIDPGSSGPGEAERRIWATAACPGGEALYLVQGDKEPNGAFLREALAGFARESAERHGCAEPVLP
ncbi:hypothetical protein [Kitasatospora sp. NPDC057198]|uniref:hypothetical protein n=1 Tax=Kitasatospora sp. NPDC057198 TaxID=3346046 RepID=UPI00363EC063